MDNYIYRLRDFNWASYASDQSHWLLRHYSIKCYCCGHIHAIENSYRDFYLNRNDGTKILIVNNSRGYVSSGHDSTFNPNRYVNTETWTLEEEPLQEKDIMSRKKKEEKMLKDLAWFI